MDCSYYVYASLATACLLCLKVEINVLIKMRGFNEQRALCPGARGASPTAVSAAAHFPKRWLRAQ